MYLVFVYTHNPTLLDNIQRLMQARQATVQLRHIQKQADLLSLLEARAGDALIFDDATMGEELAKVLHCCQHSTPVFPLLVVGAADRERVEAVLAMGVGSCFTAAEFYQLPYRLAYELDISATRYEVNQLMGSLYEHASEFHAFTEAIRELFCLHTPAGLYLYVSPSSENIIGYYPHELIGTDPYDYFHPDDKEHIRIQAHEPALNAGDILQNITYRFRHKHGYYVWLQTNTQVVQDASGEIVRLVCISHVVDEEEPAAAERLARPKQDVEQMEPRQRITTLRTNILSMILHEFRNPLTTIRLTLDNLRWMHERMSAEERMYRFNKIGRGVTQLTDLLEHILLAAKIESGTVSFEKQELDLVLLCQDIMRDYREGQGQQHDLQFHSNMPQCLLLADEVWLRHMLNNLLVNAIHYSPEQTSIRLELECSGAGVLLRVVDRGIGIPLESQGRIFEAFYRGDNVRSTKGTGLGLAVVRHGVEIHNGTIQMESSIGLGTTFTIWLPRPPRED